MGNGTPLPVAFPFRRARFTTVRVWRRPTRRKSLSDRKNRHPELAKDLASNCQARCFAALNMTVSYARLPKRRRASLFSERNPPNLQRSREHHKSRYPKTRASDIRKNTGPRRVAPASPQACRWASPQTQRKNSRPRSSAGVGRSETDPHKEPGKAVSQGSFHNVAR